MSGVIAIQTSALLGNPGINYVIMAGCGIKPLEKAYPDFRNLKGNFLSVYAGSDKVAGSCGAAFSGAKQGVTGEEIVLGSAAGHRLFFAPDDLWLSPVIAWLKKGE